MHRAPPLLRGSLHVLAGCLLVAGLGIADAWGPGGTAVAVSTAGRAASSQTSGAMALRPQMAESGTIDPATGSLVPPPPPEPQGPDTPEQTAQTTAAGGNTGPREGALPAAAIGGTVNGAASLSAATDPAAGAVQPRTIAQAVAADADARQAEQRSLTRREAAKEAAAMAEAGSEVEKLVDRGTELLELGDVAAARLFFELAWSEGNVQAATGLGKTFDPVYLGSRNLKWSTANPVQAIDWYRKAVAEDDDEAGQRLRELTVWMGLPADVADKPTLEVQPASGREGESVPLEIAAELTDTDGSESLSVTISGLPEGMALSAGSTDGSGAWRLRHDDLKDLAIAPNADFSGQFELTVIAKAREASNGDRATEEATITVDVASVADEPSLGVRPVEGLEDSPIPLDIVAATNDTDGSESLSLVIAGVPEGATLSAGTSLGDQRWELGANHLTGLTLTPSRNFSGQFTLTTSATASEAAGDSATKEERFDVSVIGVADEPSLGVRPFSSEEGNTAALDILSMLQDKDGSESLLISVTGLPAGATLSDGKPVGDGAWQLRPNELAGLTLSLAPNVSGDFEITVEAKATERDGDTATRAATVAATVAAVANAPRLAVTPASGEEGVPLTLDIAAELSDTDGSESLLVTIAGVPEGASLSAGTSGDGGVWHLQPDDLEGLVLNLDPNMSGAFTLSVSATASEASGDIATVKDTIAVTITGIADPPRLAVLPAEGTAGDLIPLQITAALEDTDGSESLGIVIAELPDGARLSAGIDQGNGDWDLESKDLAGLALLPAPGSAGSFELTVAATAQEADGDKATKATTMAVSIAAPTVAEVPEVPSELPAADDESFAIQVSSLRSMEGAENEWARLQAIHPDVLDGLDLAVQEIELDSRGVFYRVLGGPFYNKTTAEDICGQLEVEDPAQYCLVVRYPFDIPDDAAEVLEVAGTAADIASLESGDAPAPPLPIAQGSTEDASDAEAAAATGPTIEALASDEPQSAPQGATAALGAKKPGKPADSDANPVAAQKTGALAKASDVTNFTITSAALGQGIADDVDTPGDGGLTDSVVSKFDTEQAALPDSAAAGEATVVARADLSAPIESEDAKRLMSRGNELLELGDAAAARLFYELAAEAHGSAAAATAVGKTLDPLFLAEVGIRGPASDPDRAMAWYKNGISRGDPEAEQLLNRLYAWTVANKTQ